MPRVHKIKLSQETSMWCSDFPFFPSFACFLFVVLKQNSKTCFEAETKTILDLIKKVFNLVTNDLFWWKEGTRNG